MDAASILAVLLIFIGAVLISRSRQPADTQEAAPASPPQGFARPFSHIGTIADIATFTDPSGGRHVKISLMSTEGPRDLFIRHPDMIRDLRDVDVRTEFRVTGMIRDGVPMVDHINPHHAQGSPAGKGTARQDGWPGP